MNTRMKLASFCYLSNAVAFLIIGLTFVFAREFFPFHSDVIQTPWSGLSVPVQTLYLGMMRTEGAGYLASATAIAILYYGPFLRGEQWSYWAMSGIGIVEHLPTFFANLHVYRTTEASPPWPAVLIGMVLLVAGLVLSIQGSRPSKTNRGQREVDEHEERSGV